MRKVNLKVLEQIKYETIKKVVDNGCLIADKKRAAIKLNCTLRTINRLINVYIMEGKQGFSHKNKCKPPINKIDEAIKEDIITNYVINYRDANLVHYSLIVKEDYDLDLSDETIRLWLLERNIISPKTHRITKKRIKKRLNEKLKASLSKKEKNDIKEKIKLLDKKDVHPRRERSKYFGEMIQMDASEFEWIKGNKWQLHLAIDDATNMVVGAYFDKEETLNGYYHVLHQILIKYGIPAMFYTDRRTVFDYIRKKRAFDDEDTFTQFSYCCHKLGIEIKTTSVPQAKGRIERLNGSFQSRLPIELRRANVESIEEANSFLLSYLDKYNNEFALQLNITKTVFLPQPSKEDIDKCLAVLTVRTVDGGNCVKFKNKFYIPVNRFGNDIYINEGTKILMVETFDDRLYLNAYDNLYQVREIKTNKDLSTEFDENIVKEEKRWEVPRNHPWKTQDFLNFLSKQKHRKDLNKNNNQNLC